MQHQFLQKKVEKETKIIFFSFLKKKKKPKERKQQKKVEKEIKIIFFLSKKKPKERKQKKEALLESADY